MSHEPESAAPVTTDMLSERYTVIEELGSGANGRVVAAHDRILDRTVAVKMLIQGDSVETARFIREARITARLEHPNIVPLHDLEYPSVGNINFIMRRVVGRTLGEAITHAGNGTHAAEIATINDLLTVILKVCDALARAHSRKIIHQDVKPDNIMLGEHGEVVLVDWGEASVSGEPCVGRPSQVVGTPIYMSPEQARGEPADERSDVYCLGATLWHALLLRYPAWDEDPERFWQKKRDGALDPPTADERRKVPRRLLAIMLRAMDPLATQRYHSIQAVAADLCAFQAGQAVQAYRESPLERLTRWVNRHRAPLATSGIVLLTLGTCLWWLWGEQVKEVARWGTPLITEEFTDDSWRQRWVEEAPGMYEAHAGRLVSTAPRGARIAFRQRLQTPIAVEYDAEIMPGSIPCDLSGWWNEGPTPFVPPNVPAPYPHGFLIQAGAFSNQFSAIYRQENNERLAQIPFVLQTSHLYHVRIELDGTHVGMWLDGRLLVEHTDLFPTTSGYFALYAYFPGKAFSHLRIWEKGVAEKVSVLAIGDAAFQAGAWRLAATQYQRVADSRTGEALGNQARYREGLALLRDGQPTEAAAAWQQLGPGQEQDFVACHELDPLYKAGRHAEVAQRMTALYVRAPWVRGQLRSQWMRYLQELKDVDLYPQIADLYLAVKDRAFVDDTSTNYHYGQALLHLRRYGEVAEHVPDESLLVCEALRQLGRDHEILARPNVMPDIVTEAYIRLGQYSDAVNSTSNSSFEASVLVAMGKDGHAADGVTRYPDSAEALIAAGRADDVLQQPQRFQAAQVAALLASGRWQQAAEQKPPDPLALLLVGRDREALALMTPPAPGCPPDVRLLLAAIADDHAGVVACHAELLAEAPHYGDLSRWFGSEVLPPFLTALAGDPAAWQRLLATGSATPARGADLRNVYGQRLWFASALLRGEITDAQFLAQPTVTEGPALLLVLRGLEADLRSDPLAASAAYRAFKALPPSSRLLDGWKPNPVIERLVTWRLDPKRK